MSWATGNLLNSAEFQAHPLASNFGAGDAGTKKSSMGQYSHAEGGGYTIHEWRNLVTIYRARNSPIK